jgi:hypothetical protein
MMRRFISLLCAVLLLTVLFTLLGCHHGNDEKALPHDSSQTYKAPGVPVGGSGVLAAVPNANSQGRLNKAGLKPPPPPPPSN